MKKQSFLYNFMKGDIEKLPKNPKPIPILKWVGAKSTLLDWMDTYLVEEDYYFEPFIGGASVWCYMFREGRFKKSQISDLNPRLINFYKIVKEAPFQLIDLMESKYKDKNYAKYYRSVQKKVYEDPLEDAGLFLYLNKTSWRGMYAEDKHGDMAIGFGYRPKVKMVDYDRILNLSAALQETVIKEASYVEAVKDVPSKSLVYFDPPYYEAYTEYTKFGFTHSDHVELRNICRSLDKRGVKFVQSNNDDEWVLENYKEFKIIKKEIVYKVNFKKKVEVLITNV